MKSAITLIELLVVIALVGIIAGVGWPNLDSWNCRQDHRNSFEKFNQYMFEAKTQAINRNQSTLVSVTKSGSQVSLRAYLLATSACSIATSSQALDSQIPRITFRDEIVITGPSSQCFYSDGSADANSYQFGRECGDKSYLYKIQFFAATGLAEKLIYSRIRSAWEDL